MGCLFSNDKEIYNKNNNYNELNICTYNVGNTSIEEISNLLISNNNKIDILCLQNFQDIQDIKELIIFINKYNKKNIAQYEIYPNDLNNVNNKDKMNSIQLTWSYTLGDDNQDINGLIISKYPIISSAKIKIQTTLFEAKKYFYLTNINFNNIILTIFNIALQQDFTGITNYKIRETQIDQLIKCINDNNNMNKKNINIICGNLNINEYDDKIVNTEYVKLFRKINGLDIYSYVKLSKEIKKNVIRNDYIIIIIDELKEAYKYNNFDEQINFISDILYNNYDLYIVNSVLQPNISTIKIKNKEIDNVISNMDAFEIE